MLQATNTHIYLSLEAARRQDKSADVGLPKWSDPARLSSGDQCH